MSALFAHPAASVPFARYGLLLSALVIGSLSPDFFYLFHLSTSSQFGHTLPGLFLFCIPAGLIILWIFHTIVKYPLFSVLPTSHQERLFPSLHRFQFFSSGKRLLLIMVSLLVGAWTHILWDSCTHVYGWTVQHVSGLRFPLLVTSQGTLRVYKVLQHGGTVCGTLLLLVWYWRWFKRAATHPVPSLFHVSKIVKRRITLAIIVIAGILGISYGFYKVPAISDMNSFSYFVVFSAKAGFSSVSLGILVFSLGWHVVHYKKFRRFQCDVK